VLNHAQPGSPTGHGIGQSSSLAGLRAAASFLAAWMVAGQLVWSAHRLTGVREGGESPAGSKALIGM